MSAARDWQQLRMTGGDRYTDGQTDRQADRRTDTQKDREIDSQTDR